MADFYRELVAILRDNGCVLVRKGKEVMKSGSVP
jgi:hypothetical protein